MYDFHAGPPSSCFPGTIQFIWNMVHLGAVLPEASCLRGFSSKHTSYWQVTLQDIPLVSQHGQEQWEFLATSGWGHPFTFSGSLGSGSLLWTVPGSLLVYVTLQNITECAHFCSLQESPRTCSLNIRTRSLLLACSTESKPLALERSKKNLRTISLLLSTCWHFHPGKGWRSKRNFQIPVGQWTFQLSRT